MSLDFLFARQYDEEKYNCAHLVCEAWQSLTGADVTPFLLPVLMGREQRYFDYRQRKNFKRLERPESPCIVDMRSRGCYPHVGIYIDFDSVMQITESGVQCQPLGISTRGYKKVSFWSFKNA